MRLLLFIFMVKMLEPFLHGNYLFVDYIFIQKVILFSDFITDP